MVGAAAGPEVLIVTSSWPRSGDEIAGTFVRADALARAAAGAAVWVAAPSGPGLPRDGPGLRVVDVPHLGLFGTPGAWARFCDAPGRGIGLLPWAHAVLRLARRVRPASVVAHWLLPSGLVARAIRPCCALELVAHGGDVRLLERLPRLLSRALLCHLCDAPTTVVRAVSDGVASRLHDLAPHLRGRLRVAPMPLDPDALAAARSRGATLREGARRDPAAPLHVVAGRLVPEKRLERAIEVARARSARLVFVGDGPARDDLLARARRAGVPSECTGARPHEEALSWIAAADLLVAPLAAGEGAPTVVREAEALGVPFLALP